MTDKTEADVQRVTLTVCSLCLDGKGGECHTPGCAFWMSAAPDIPIRSKVESANSEWYWRGFYGALRLLATSVRMTKPQLEVIYGQADRAQEELRKLGVRFASDEPTTSVEWAT